MLRARGDESTRKYGVLMKGESCVTKDTIRERPLSITMVGWLGLFLGGVSLLQNLSSVLFPSSGAPRSAPDVNWCVEVLILCLLAFACLFLLKGMAWARIGMAVVLASEFLRLVLLDWSSHWHKIPLDTFTIVLALVAIYLPRNWMFFNTKGPASPLTYQVGTVLCYGVITVLLTPLISVPGGITLMEPPASYRLLLAFCILVITYGVGNAFKLVLNPRRDVGGMIIIASALSLLFNVSINVRRAGYWTAWNGGGTESNIDLSVAGATTAIGITLGAILIHISRRRPNPALNTQVESSPVTADR